MIPRLGASLELPLRGHLHLLAAPLADRAIDCDLTLQFHGVRGTVLGRRGRVLGRVTVEGLATDRALKGEVTFRGAEEGQALVTFAFDGDDGGRRTLRGFVELLPAAPLATMTEMPFSLYASDDDEIGRGVLRFDARGDLRGVLRSVRVRIGAA